MIKKFSVILISTLFLISCKPLKRLKTVTQGKVNAENFYEEIPFQYYNGQIFVEVEISQKKYHFIFDTGNDLTLLDDDLLNEIKHKSNNVETGITDAGNKTEVVRYISVENINLGKISFENTGAQVFDLSHFQESFGCLKIDGLIGNNLMRKANWQIDYDNKTIRFSDNISKLSKGDNPFIFETNSGRYGAIKLDLTILGFTRKFTFDTGFSGSLTGNITLYNEINTKEKFPSVTTNFIGTTAFGKSNSKEYSAYIPKLKIGEMELKDKIFHFKENGSNLIGNQFFQNFLVTIDWKNEFVYLEPKHKIEPDILKSYEVYFYPNFSNNTIQVSGTFEEYKLINDLVIGTPILKINNQDVSGFTQKELCDFWQNNKQKIYSNEKLEIEIIENNVPKKIVLTKKQLLPN